MEPAQDASRGGRGYVTLVDDRTQMEVLRRPPAIRLLRTVEVGRLGFLDHGRITVVPVNFQVDGQRIVFRTAPGAKLDAALEGQEVAFEADGLDEDRRVGWDVLVRGTASPITDPDDIHRLERLGVFAWARSPKADWVQIPLEDVSGRRTMIVFEPQPT